LANRAVEHLNSGTGENAKLRSTVQLCSSKAGENGVFSARAIKILSEKVSGHVAN